MSDYILFIPSWNPIEKDPGRGLFIENHAKAISLYRKIILIRIYAVKHIKKKIIINNYNKNLKIIHFYYKKVNRFFILGNKILFFYSLFYGFRKIIKNNGMPDIIHLNVLDIKYGLFLCFCKLFFNIPYIISEHSSFYIVKNNVFFIYNFFLKIIFRNANYLTCVSNYLLLSLIKKKYVINEKCSIVPNAINIPEKIKKNKTTNNKKIRLLTVSNLNKNKNVEGIINVVIKLIEKKYNIELHIIGDGIEREYLENKTKKNRLINKIVFFHGFVLNTELSNYYFNSSFFILNSNFETFSVVIIEALAHGIPVVATKCGGPEEIITDEVGILVESRNEKSLLKGIEYMINNHKKYDSFKLYNYVKNKYSYEVVGRQFYKIYQDILEGKNA